MCRRPGGADIAEWGHNITVCEARQTADEVTAFSGVAFSRLYPGVAEPDAVQIVDQSCRRSSAGALLKCVFGTTLTLSCNSL